MRENVTRMTPNEFVAALRELKLSQNGFARFTGTNDRTVRRWAHGQQDIPQWVSVMLELCKCCAKCEGVENFGFAVGGGGV
jgi:DNA-binding transcriptional regulator YiaG